MADAAIFRECTSGRTYPVAQEADYTILERTYLKDQAGPGAPLYATIEGGLVMREPMEGEARPHVVVSRLVNTWPDKSCEQNRSTAVLQNAYWRIISLMDEDLAPVPNRREPHLILRTGWE